ncbi:4'-phosphopantetheinyl transferase HetI-like isoform X2 [Telopea speciosissima]|uniref:4'-phosphopantetheinyl transferase HetI-like isoform X2 n=1 Tax=Telopea speciosissima TaxID=54955 RepID=UPI001CC334C4|nr:4'-phosphopantetheinyl transferase HetI-like isoform X2 [Telopea speciosissima]
MICSMFCRVSSSMQINCFTRKFVGSSSPLVSIALPSRRETHFWYILPDEVQNKSLLNQYLELLSHSEKENVFRMHGEELQKRAILARALVRTTLARYTNSWVCPRSLKFGKNNYGKPEVKWQDDEEWDPPSLHFNISHTSSLIACGVTVDTPIGIDVEDTQRKLRNNVLSFAQRYFSPYEVELLHAISDPDTQRQEFIKLWTLKEAYVKALGRGFSSAPFNTFTIRFRPSSSSGLHVDGDSNSEASEIVVEAFEDPENLTSNWQFTLFELAGTHYAAICKEKDNILNGEVSGWMRLKVWRTIPFVEDECVCGTEAVKIICGMT